MSVVNEVRTANEQYASTFDRGELAMPQGGSSPSSPAWTPGSTRGSSSGSKRGTPT